MSDEFDEFNDVWDDSFLKQLDAIEKAATQPRSVTAPTSSKPPAAKRSTFSLFAQGGPGPSTAASAQTKRTTSGPATFNPPPRAVASGSKPTSGSLVPRRPRPPAPARAPPKPPSSDPYDLSLDLDLAAIASLDHIEDTFQRTGSTSSSARYQTTLYGTLARSPPRPAGEQGRPSTSSAAAGRAAGGGAMAPARAGPFGQRNQRTKQWDRTQFAATGNRNRGKKKGKKRKRKGHETGSDEDGEEDEEVEFEQFPAPFVSLGPPPPMKLVPDPDEIREWIYPINKPIRDYQYNIVQAALFKNTLVALPTGLGKTFIAGVLMLNYYRWFPQGRVVFVAPTKPLVSQQIRACHETCGIPVEDAIEMTGETPQAQRERHWQSKRVIYMTPQTLQNDLLRDVVDAKDIILLVVDEAHKATGNYAYATVVRYMMAKNPHFRILALTATPGSKPETVQEIIDSLHIGHIEIRDERSLDLKQYIHEKTMEKCVVQMGASISAIKDKLIALMESTVKPLRGKDIFPEYVRLAEIHPYRCKHWMDELRRKPQGKQYPWATAFLMRLHKLTFAMAYLCEESVEMAYNTLLDAAGKKTTGKEGGNKLSNDPKYRELITEIEDYRNERTSTGGPVGHPKMDKLVSVALEHFTAPDEGADHTRVMVFCQYRDCVDEIVKSLNLQQPIIRASKFVGQSSDKRGDKGMAQKDQIQMIKRFKQGEFNVLVATSIGEEGLDIGEVDLIICYDVQKSSIKMLQRIGRTGRKRTGKIVVLMAEGREEPNWDAANDNYSAVQESIIRGDQLELFDDDERLIPDDVRPVVRKQHMEIQEFASQDARVTRRRSGGNPVDRAPKRQKRNDDPNRNIPEGALSGFISAAKLVPKGKSAADKQLTLEDLQHDLEDDDDDADITRGRLSETPISSPEDRRRSALSRLSQGRHSRTTDRRVSTSSTIELCRDLEEDSDDADLEAGLDDMLEPKPISHQRSNDGPADIVRISSDEDSPVKQQLPKGFSSNESATKPTTPNERPSEASWLLDSDSDIDHKAMKPHLTRAGLGTPWRAQNQSWTGTGGPSVELSPIVLSPIEGKVNVSTPAPNLSRTRLSSNGASHYSSMGPPPIPKNRILSSDDSPFPVRRKVAPIRNRNMVTTQDKSLDSMVPTHYSPPVVAQRGKRQPRPKLYSKPNRFFDIEANLSGSDHGEDADEAEWSESDRQFLKDTPATQAVSKGDEQAMYLQGLMTQAPGRSAPMFKHGPTRHGALWTRTRSNQVAISSSEADPNSEPNEYELGSFIVADDDTFDLDDAEDETSMLE